MSKQQDRRRALSEHLQGNFQRNLFTSRAGRKSEKLSEIWVKSSQSDYELVCNSILMQLCGWQDAARARTAAEFSISCNSSESRRASVGRAKWMETKQQ
jgi:hypothetical protein